MACNESLDFQQGEGGWVHAPKSGLYLHVIRLEHIETGISYILATARVQQLYQQLMLLILALISISQRVNIRLNMKL